MATSTRRGSVVDRTGVRPRWVAVAVGLLLAAGALAAIGAREAGEHHASAVVLAVLALVPLAVLTLWAGRSLAVYRDHLEIETAVLNRVVAFGDLRSLTFVLGVWVIRWRHGRALVVHDRHVGRVLGQLVTRAEQVRVRGRATLAD